MRWSAPPALALVAIAAGAGPASAPAAVPGAKASAAKQLKKLKHQVGSLQRQLKALSTEGDPAPAHDPLPASLPPSGPAGGDLTGAFPNPLIAPDAVGSAEIQANAVGSEEVGGEALSGVDIADGTVFAAELAADSVGTDEVLEGSVGTADIADFGIRAIDLADDSVGAAELKGLTVAVSPRQRPVSTDRRDFHHGDPN